MKEGYLLKRKTEHGVVSPQELEKINQYTRRNSRPRSFTPFPWCCATTRWTGILSVLPRPPWKS